MKDGKAVRLRMTESTTPQTNSGRCPKFMPWVRMIIGVVRIFTAAMVVEVAKIRIRKQYASMPGVRGCTARGAYPVQPVGKPPRKRVDRRTGMAEKSSQ